MINRIITLIPVALTSLLLAGCTSSTAEDQLQIVSERLDHFHQEFADDGVLVPPLLAQGSAQIPDFDFDLDEGYVLTVYCIGEATLEISIAGEPSNVDLFECENGMTTMARDAPDMTLAESNIVVTTEDQDSYWLAAVTRATEQHRAGA